MEVAEAARLMDTRAGAGESLWSNAAAQVIKAS
jgi:hypothetical protein